MDCNSFQFGKVWNKVWNRISWAITVVYIPMTPRTGKLCSCCWTCTAMLSAEQKTVGAGREYMGITVDAVIGQDSLRGLPNHSIGSTWLPFWQRKNRHPLPGAYFDNIRQPLLLIPPVWCSSHHMAPSFPGQSVTPSPRSCSRMAAGKWRWEKPSLEMEKRCFKILKL